MCSLDILRDSTEHHLTVQLMRPNALVPHHLAGGDPSYLVIAGVVFTVVTEPYLQSEYGGDYHSTAPVKLLDRLLYGHKRWPDEEVVVVSQVLACDATLGYEDLFNTQVFAFNGQPVRNLRHLAEMALQNKEEFIRIDMDYDELLVLNTESAWQATKDVLAMHSIPSICSKDLQDVLGGMGNGNGGGDAVVVDSVESTTDTSQVVA